MLKDILPKIAPKIKNLDYADLLEKHMPLYGITGEAIPAFIAQLAHESNQFLAVKEYASGEAYEGRKDLGNINKGDGVKFKGRGLIQITGRNNYLEVSKVIFNDNRLLNQPELLEQPEWAVVSACYFWKSRGLSEIANKPDTWKRTFKGKQYDKFQWITLRINGGQNGYPDRLKYYQRAKQLLK